MLFDSCFYDDKIVPSVIAITETWLTSASALLLDAVIPQSYEVLSRSRDTRAGGGVVLIVKKTLHPVKIEVADVNIELVACEIQLNGKKTKLFCIYQPNQNDVMYAQSVLAFLRSTLVNLDRFVILGDLNLSNIAWDAAPTGTGVYSLYQEFCVNTNALQYVKEPTRGKNILDVVLCNDNRFIGNVYTLQPLFNSDHMSVVGFFVNENVSASPAGACCHARLVPKLNRRSIADINLFLSTVDWSLICNDSMSLEENWYNFVGVLNYAFHLLVRFGRAKSGYRDYWYSENIRQKVSLRRNYAAKMNGTKQVSLKLYYKSRWRALCLEIKQMCKASKLAYEKKNFNQKNRSIKTFYNYCNSFFKTKRPIPCLKLNNDCLFVDSEKAQALNTEFSKIYTSLTRLIADLYQKMVLLWTVFMSLLWKL